MIVGRELAKRPPVSHTQSQVRPVFARLSNLSARTLKPTSILLSRGEILGVTGLIGSGYEEVPYLVYGARPCESGSLSFEGDLAFRLRGNDAAPSDRSGLRSASGRSTGRERRSTVCRSSTTCSCPTSTGSFARGRMRNGAMVKEALALGAAFEVRPNDPHMRLSALSGGNAQKVLDGALDEPQAGAAAARRTDPGRRRRNAGNRYSLRSGPRPAAACR